MSLHTLHGWTRRALLAALAAGLAACATPVAAPADPFPPIVFVHGNSDTAALWMSTLWRYESNGWPRERLHAVHLPDPSARDDDGVAQPGRSSAAEHARFIADELDAVLARTGARQAVLVGNSRGGLGIRHALRHLGAAPKVSHVVLGGTPNHGVWADAALRPGSEFNGAGPILRALNAPQGPDGAEVTPGPRWMTLRSDGQDKFMQPDGRWLGRPGQPTGVDADSAALKGALNRVLPGRDHREVSYHPQAFAATFEFVTGRPPATLEVRPEARAVLDGVVSGLGPGGADNRPLPGATVEVWAVDPATGERRGAALHRRTVGADGRWGPFDADPQAFHEFVVSAPGYATKHVYRPPFPRSSTLVHLRAERLPAADRNAGAVVTFTRPRGYFGVPRDALAFDGRRPPPDVPPGVPGVAVSRVVLEAPGRAVAGEFNGQRLVGRAWPAAENRLTVLELHD